MDNFYGKYRAKVTENDDPDNQGRIKVKVPKLFGDNETDWCYPCVPICGNGVGFFFLPQKDDLVWVEFEGGDSRCPIWSGGWWKKGSNPEGATVGIDILQTTSGHKIKFINKDTKKLIIEDSSGQRIEMDETGGNISIQNKVGRISLSGLMSKIVMTNAGDSFGGIGIPDIGLGGILPTGDIPGLGAGSLGAFEPAMKLNETLTSTVSTIQNGISDAMNTLNLSSVSSLTDLFTNNIGATVGSLATQLQTIATSIGTQGSGLIGTLNVDALDNVTNIMNSVPANFTEFFNNELVPGFINGDFIDPKYEALINQGLGEGIVGGVPDGGILGDILSITEGDGGTYAGINADINTQLGYIQGIISGQFLTDINTYIASNASKVIDSVTGLAASEILSSFTQSGAVMGTLGVQGVSAIASGAGQAMAGVGICSFAQQTFEINGLLGRISMSDSTGQSVKIDSLLRTVSMNDFMGQSITIAPTGIHMVSTGLITLI